MQKGKATQGYKQNLATLTIASVSKLITNVTIQMAITYTYWCRISTITKTKLNRSFVQRVFFATIWTMFDAVVITIKKVLIKVMKNITGTLQSRNINIYLYFANQAAQYTRLQIIQIKPHALKNNSIKMTIW